MGIGWLLDRQPVDLLPFVIITLLISNWWVTLITPDAKAITYGTAPLAMLQIIRKPEVLAFFVVNLLLQLAHAPYYVFYSIYLKHYHYSTSVTGLLWALGVLAEIVLFIFTRSLLNRFSLRAILLFSLVLATGRWLMIGWYPEYLGLLVIAQLFLTLRPLEAHMSPPSIWFIFILGCTIRVKVRLYTVVSVLVWVECWVVFLAAITGSQWVQGWYIQYLQFVAE